MLRRTAERATSAVDSSSTGTRVPKMWESFEGSHDSEELSCKTISTIGLDSAKSVFQAHGALSECLLAP